MYAYKKGRKKVSGKIKKQNILLILSGIFTGAVNGVFGGGGGMIAVPLLNSLLQKPTNVSHATAILVILPISFASGIMYLFNGYFDAELFIAVGLGVLAGGFFGAELLGKLSAGSITLIFAIIMFAAGIKMIF
ncbi:MAG: TSUP family transporter [Candidatus Borkfalkia sp.]